ncbi:DUF5018-related domain-containing protein [Sunxiuqinia sp. sy24]|uniref:DUF5018-related domain-containing protein n=1 Tax=Sunxiuqinia sp. sy24 TaxID=3461495 RepID=UPI00404611DE
MKKIIFINLILTMLLSGCMQPVDVNVDVLPDNPDISSIKVGLMSETGLFQTLPVTLEEINTEDKTITVYLKTFMSMERIWVSTRTEDGCQITPLGEAPELGTYGDYTSPRKYRVTAPSGNSAEWTISIMQDPNLPDISCLANLWTGADLACDDEPFPSYSPTIVTGEQLDGDCNKIKLTLNFWADGNAVIELELELGAFDESTFIGEVTLLKTVSFSSYGSNMTYEAGPAGTYNLNSLELNFDAAFSGYSGWDSYPLSFYKK